MTLNTLYIIDDKIIFVLALGTYVFIKNLPILLIFCRIVLFVIAQ